MAAVTLMLWLDILFLGYEIKVVDPCFIMSTNIYHKAIMGLLICSKRLLKISFFSILFHCKNSWYPPS